MADPENVENTYSMGDSEYQETEQESSRIPDRPHVAPIMEEEDEVQGPVLMSPHELFECFLENNPPALWGTETPSQTNRFLAGLDTLFKSIGLEGRQRTRFATYRLRGEARIWWRTYHQLDSENSPMEWDQFMELIREKFVQRRYVEVLGEELTQLRQGNGSVRNYANRFSELCSMLPNVYPTERERIERFLNGLRREVYIKVTRMYFVSLREARYAAIKAEEEEEALQISGRPSSSQVRLPEAPWNMICSECGQPGHLRQDCP